jgi:hypothetical protein
MSPSFRANQPQQHQDTENPQQIPRSAVHDLPSADNPLWWPKAAASSFQPRPFGGRSLPKASRLPKAGSAVVTDTGRLYKYATLTSNAAAVCSDPMDIRHLDQCYAVGRSSLISYDRKCMQQMSHTSRDTNLAYAIEENFGA